MDMKAKANEMMKNACEMCEDAGMDPMDILKEILGVKDESQDSEESMEEEAPAKGSSPRVQMIIASMKKKMK